MGHDHVRGLTEAYAGSVVEVDWHGERIVVAPRPAGETIGDFPVGARTIHVVTAHNPAGRVLDEHANAERNAQLRAELDELGWCHHDAVGRSPDGSWSEASFAVVDVDRGAVVDLAARHEQLAVFEWTADHRAIVWCRSDLADDVHGWEAHVEH